MGVHTDIIAAPAQKSHHCRPAGTTPATEAELRAPPQLDKLISRFLAAEQKWEAIDRLNEVEEVREALGLPPEPTAQEKRRERDAYRRLMGHAMALWSYEPRSFNELALMAPIISKEGFGPYELQTRGQIPEWFRCQIQRLSTQSPIPPGSSDDELRALIEEHRTIWAEAEAAPIETKRQEKANDRRWAKARQTMDHIEAFEPRTAAGLTAKAAHVLRWAEYTSCPSDGLDLAMCEGVAASVLRDVVRLGGFAGPTPTDENTIELNGAWAAAGERMSEAKAALDRAYAAQEAAEQAADAEIEELGIPADILLPDGTAMEPGEVAAIKGLPEAVRARLSALSESHQAQRDAIFAKHRVWELNNAVFPASFESRAARKAVLSLTPPSPRWFLVQMQMVALEQHCIDLESPDDIRRALTGAERGDKARHAQEFIQLYRHACQLAGFESATASVTQWDADEFIDQFEQHPGHYMTRRGPVWIEFEMPGYISDGDAAIRDPERIRKYDAICGRVTSPRSLATGIIVSDFDRLREVYSDAPDEGERLIAIVTAHRERAWMEDWPGSDMWVALEDWQKAAVKEAMLHRVDREQVRRLVEGANIELREYPQLGFDATAAAVDDYLSRRVSPECRPGEAWPVDVRAAREQVLRGQSYPLAAE